MSHRLLFILKRRECGPYGDWGYGGGLSSGLLNSAKFVVDMLVQAGISAKLVQVHDNNDIDREVVRFRPTDVLIEAFWVVPEKFDVLKKLHPKVHWIVRDHSKTSFLANEGMAFGWTLEYLARGVEVACNSPQAVHDMQVVATSAWLPAKLVTYLPNFYPTSRAFPMTSPIHGRDAHIGCFGAIRPLKNQMTQAIAALEFAKRLKLKLFFHINGNRVEGNGSPILKNLRQLFAGVTGAQLVEHAWTDHDRFIATMRLMDISLQVSFSETFNIVTADAIVSAVPVVVSDQVPFLDKTSFADPDDTDDIAGKMVDIWREWCPPRRLKRNLKLLTKYSTASRAVWLSRFH